MIMDGVIQDTMGTIPFSLHTWTGWLVQVSNSIDFTQQHRFALLPVEAVSLAGTPTDMGYTLPMPV